MEASVNTHSAMPGIDHALVAIRKAFRSPVLEPTNKHRKALVREMRSAVLAADNEVHMALILTASNYVLYEEHWDQDTDLQCRKPEERLFHLTIAAGGGSAAVQEITEQARAA